MTFEHNDSDIHEAARGAWHDADARGDDLPRPMALTAFDAADPRRGDGPWHPPMARYVIEVLHTQPWWRS